MKTFIERLLNQYIIAKSDTFAEHEMGSFIRTNVPATLYSSGIVDEDKYLVKGSVGNGNWARVPWVAIFDKNITTTAQKGVYIVYLLAKDGNSLYLTLNQGCTEIKETRGKREAIRILKETARKIRSEIDSRGFLKDDEGFLGENIGELGELYEKGIIFYQKYNKNEVPDNDVLQEDLKKMIEIYTEYAQSINSKNAWLLTWNPDKWNWEDFGEAVEKAKTEEGYNCTWSCANTNVLIGDRVFLSILGTPNNGIIASGYATGTSFVDLHWDEELAAEGKTVNRINVKFDKIINYKKEDFLSQHELKELFPGQHWSTQSSGIMIKEDYVKPLEQLWEKYGVSSVNLLNKDIVEKIKKYIAGKGFYYETGLLENFYLSLKSKPFVLLAGTSGTGKTRLVKLFAEAVGATSENGRYKMVAVRPDWSDSSDLLGHIDLNGIFVPGAIYDFVKRAMDNKEKPYFLCLDEMNLARVEYYFSDFLSIIETRDMDDNGNISSEVLYLNKALAESEKLYLPENLYIIGTVNMDETTFPFSRKVLDRANTIEFSYVNLNVDTLESFGEVNQLDLDNEFLKSKYLLLAHCKDELDYVSTRADELQKINEILQKADAHVGYRVRDEIIFYLLNNKESKLIDENEAFDNELMQKILPRIQGSSEVIKKMLCDLFTVCFIEPTKVQTESDNTFELMYKQCEAEDCKYKHSARKIAFMVRRFEEDGFTSYWL